MPHANALVTLNCTWELASERYAGYALLLPGDPAFRCQPETCDAHCCRKFNVSLGDADLARLTAAGHEPLEILETVDDEPLALPTNEPWLLRRRDGSCFALEGDLSCRVYAERPTACRLYPHQLLVLDPADGRPRRWSDAALGEAVRALLSGRPLPAAGPVPVLVRHTECPGFTEAPHTGASWSRLVAETAALQFPHLAAELLPSAP